MRREPSCALVTGASLGLGRALASELAGRGLDLVLVALPGSGLAETGQDIAREHGVRVECLEADLTDEETPRRILDLARTKGMEIDVLVNNAGIGTIGFFADSHLSRHEASIGVNVLALVRLTHHLVPEFRKRDAAYILNVSSLSAFFPMPYMPTYSATKSFVVSFSLALRDELAETVSVSVVCPNTIRTSPETEAFIDRLSFPCRRACLYPSEIARSAVDGMLKGKAVIVPGLINRLLRIFGPYVPRSLVIHVIRRYWGKFESETRALAPKTA